MEFLSTIRLFSSSVYFEKDSLKQAQCMELFMVGLHAYQDIEEVKQTT